MLDALTVIDPGLASYDGDEAKVVDYARQEFDGGHASVDMAKATDPRSTAVT